jgi:phospholipid-binding lipoprotein MlaA
MHQFNTDFDNAFLKPVAKAYQAVTPEPVDRSVTNFFNNIADVTSAVNNLLQFKLSRFGSDVGRVAVNSTVGIGGLFDVATNVGLPSYKEDFGQTLGYWGAGESPYFVLPLIGPSTVRDTVGFAGDVLVDPFFSVNKNEIYWGFVGLRLVDRRADLLTASKILEEAALDPYAFTRDAFLQRRRSTRSSMAIPRRRPDSRTTTRSRRLSPRSAEAGERAALPGSFHQPPGDRLAGP